MTLAWLIQKSILTAIIFGITLVVAMYATLAERKFAAFFQDRIGPDRAGPYGLLQPLCDGVKFFFKEEFTPVNADKFLFILGPCVSMIAACMTTAVIPWGKPLQFMGHTISLQISDLNIGILYLAGVISLGVYGIMLGGWASNNKFSVLSAIRASSQMISYELAMGLAIIALIMTTGTLNIGEIVAQQAGGHWNIFFQPLGFLIFIICSFAEANRVPFDLAECETELIGGYHTEYSSMKLGFYLFAEYINMFIASAIMASLYFGGYQGMSFLHLPGNLDTLAGTTFFGIKIIFFMFLFIWIRWTIPRFRYDQLMRLGWKILLPLSIANMVLTGIILLGVK